MLWKFCMTSSHIPTNLLKKEDIIYIIFFAVDQQWQYTPQCYFKLQLPLVTNIQNMILTTIAVYKSHSAKNTIV